MKLVLALFCCLALSAWMALASPQKSAPILTTEAQRRQTNLEQQKMLHKDNEGLMGEVQLTLLEHGQRTIRFVYSDRDLQARFDSIFDQLAQQKKELSAIQQENKVLKKEMIELQQRAESIRRDILKGVKDSGLRVAYRWGQVSDSSEPLSCGSDCRFKSRARKHKNKHK